MKKLLLICLIGIQMGASQKVIIWDNDGTIMESKDPNDKFNSAKVLLPNVEAVMRQDDHFNVICSGMKTSESESQNFDPEIIITKFKKFMTELPVSIATFSPAMSGTQCWVLIKDEQDNFSIVRAIEFESILFEQDVRSNVRVMNV